MKPSKCKQNVLQLACKQAIYGFTKFFHRFPMEYNICTGKLCPAATVYFLLAKSFAHACHYNEGFSCSNC